MIDFLLGVVVGAAFAPYWVKLGNLIWEKSKAFLNKTEE